jgi:hypothetical protein
VSDKPPCRSRRLLQLPSDFVSLPSKRRRVFICGTHTSTIQTDFKRMSTEPGLQNSGSLSTLIPTIVNGTPSTPATSMVVVPEAPIITIAQPIVNAHATASNPFGSLGHSSGYNVQSIPMASSPFSYGMPNFTSQFSSSIPVVGPNASIRLGGSTPPYTPFSFGGSQIPQMTPNMGGMPAFNPGSNLPTFGWTNQPGGQASAQVPSYNPTSSTQSHGVYQNPG